MKIKKFEYSEYLKKYYNKFSKKLLGYINLNDEIISREGIAEVIAANLIKDKLLKKIIEKII